ncbi:MAG: T9SS type A sorting domain-containing protein [Bacteroidia bacterium]|nr:T9SS type A sorting domain-containing protein [Bacteroidia bacterium]
MKKLILISVALIFTNIVLAQPITITCNDMPKAGRVNIVTYDTSSQVSIGQADSVSQTWNFSALVNHYQKIASYSPTAPYQQYASSFPGSNLYTYGPSYLFAGFYGAAPVDQGTWGYMYWATDSGGFSIVGFRTDYGIGQRNILETPSELLMGTPADYGSVFNNSAQWTAIFNANPSDHDTNYVSKVKKTLTVDAFGQLTTAFGTFDVLRVHEFYKKTDSVFVSYNNFPVPGYDSILSIDTVHNYYFWAKNIGYPVAIVHCNNNNVVQNIEYLTDTLSGYSITGTVYTDNGASPITSGIVKLIAKEPWDHLFGIEEILDIDNNGHFQFANVLEGGNWLILAEPDTSTYPYHMPTYYGNQLYWEFASPLYPVSDTNISITTLYNIYSAQVNYGDPGQINGTVWENLPGAKSINPAGDINITLIDASDSAAMRFTKTDHLGTYHFKNVSNRTYKIIVDVPGDKMDSTYSVTVNNSVHNNLDFMYDTSKVYVYNSNLVKYITTQNRDVLIYPNPFKDMASVIVNLDGKEFIYTFTVFDLLGKTIKEFTGRSDRIIRIDRDGLNEGMYFFDLRINGTLKYNGKILVN